MLLIYIFYKKVMCPYAEDLPFVNRRFLLHRLSRALELGGSDKEKGRVTWVWSKDESRQCITCQRDGIGTCDERKPFCKSCLLLIIFLLRFYKYC
jgi:hypothetical protein